MGSRGVAVAQVVPAGAGDRRRHRRDRRDRRFYTDDIEGEALLAAVASSLVCDDAASRDPVYRTNGSARRGALAGSARIRDACHPRRGRPGPHGADPADPPAGLHRRRELTDVSSYQGARQTATAARSRFPWSSGSSTSSTRGPAVIVPLFVLANAGIPLGVTAIAAALTHRWPVESWSGWLSAVRGYRRLPWLAHRLRVARLPKVPRSRASSGSAPRRHRLHGLDLHHRSCLWWRSPSRTRQRSRSWPHRCWRAASDRR